MTDYFKIIVLSMTMAFTFAAISFGQSTEFTYQGRLLDSNLPPTANYDFEFTLWNSLANGTQQGPTQTVSGVAVANGIFTVRLNFGAQFDGSARFLQISMRAAGGGVYTTLAPRQSITSGPYAIRSLNSTTADTATNALQLGGVAANQYVVTTDTRMTDARNPLPNSANYIWNQNSVQQPLSNFVISGNGSIGGTLAANVVRAETQFNIGGNRILSNPGSNNLFAGVGAGSANTGSFNSFFGTSAGLANTSGFNNSFFGSNSGDSNTIGNGNSFFGYRAGAANTEGSGNSFFGSGSGDSNTTGSSNSFFGIDSGDSTATGNSNSFFGRGSGSLNTEGSDNSFFGRNAGFYNTTGFENSFFGRDAGLSNVQGFHNSFFGKSAGASNTVGSRNAFFGTSAGNTNTTGAQNTFFGNNAGNTNTTGERNTIIGYSADLLGNNLRNATAVGYRAAVGADQSLVLGSISGVNGCGDFGSVCESVNVGIGTTTPLSRLHVVGGTDATLASSGYIVTGDFDALNVIFDNNEIMARNNGAASQLLLNADGGNVGIGTTSAQDTLHVDGIIRVDTLGAAGATQLCRNASNQIATCSSSLRYKTNVGKFSQGMSFVNKLSPITYDWKDGRIKDVGFGAEDIAKIDSRFVTYNSQGEIEGVKYDRLSVAFVNAFKEQQAQITELRALSGGQAKKLEEQQSAISRQQSVIELQQKQLDELKKLVCAQNATAEICKEEK